MLNARARVASTATCTATLDEVCRRAIARARTGQKRFVAYVPPLDLDVVLCCDADVMQRGLALLVEEALSTTRAEERVEVRWRLEGDEAVVRVTYSRPLACGERMVTFFDDDAAPGEDRRRIVGAREALLELGGTLARVRTPRGTAYVASVPRAGRVAAAVGAAPRSAGARGAAGRWSASRCSEANDEGDGAERRPRFLHGVDRGREVIDMAKAIFIGAAQASRLRDLVEQHLEGREAATAERLSDELDRAVILADGRVPSDVVAIGSRVRFVEERSGATRDVVLVYPSDADASAGRISVLAPVGAALIGLRAGDRIDWPLPGGRTARIRIAAVEQDTPVPQEAVA